MSILSDFDVIEVIWAPKIPQTIYERVDRTCRMLLRYFIFNPLNHLRSHSFSLSSQPHDLHVLDRLFSVFWNECVTGENNYLQTRSPSVSTDVQHTLVTWFVISSLQSSRQLFFDTCVWFENLVIDHPTSLFFIDIVTHWGVNLLVSSVWPV